MPAPDNRIPPVYFLPRGVAPPDRLGLPLAGLTILLVEDSRFASDAIRLLSQRSGARLRRAETLEQARAHLRTYRPDLVIVDIGLPDGNGGALIAEIAAVEAGPVVIGTSGDSDARAAALAAGARGFLEKPVAGLAAFQAELMRHFSGRFLPTAEAGAERPPHGDRLALQDDLAHAADLLATRPDAPRRRYLGAFLRGIALATGDAALAEAAAAAAEDASAIGGLTRILQDRLAEFRPI